MTDTIDAVIAALVDRGNATQLQWADQQASWDEGTIIARRDRGAIVLTQLGRGEDGDRVERFDSEDEAAAELRRRLVDPPVRQWSPRERAEARSRMQLRAQEIKAELQDLGGEPEA